jgi:hypothetical protein
MAMKSNDHCTIKLVSQLIKLNYEGVRQKKQASVSRMNALLGINNPDVPNKGPKGPKTSLSRELYSMEFTASTGEATGIKPKPLSLQTEATLSKFMSYADSASAMRKRFFTEVENGKGRLLSKYGERKAIPKEEVAALAKELRPYGCTIWKHQIVVTRTQSTSFEGARLTKDGRYTATVKSKTIYTMGPLTDEQVEDLIKILTGELKADTSGIVAQRTTENGYVALWRNPETGRIVMTEDISQFI